MSTKSPAFQFYAHDFVGGRVATYALDEIGAYSLLLAYDWNLNGLPMELEKLAKLCRVSPRTFRKIWRNIGEQFPITNGRRYNPRLELERKRQAENREKRTRAARTRWNAHEDAHALQVECPPSPTPTPSPKEQKEKKEKRQRAALSVSPDEARVCDHYLVAHPKRRIGDKDIKAVRKALGFGYSAAELCEAIDGNAADGWHREKHKHELTYVLRDQGHIDGFRVNAEPVQPIVDEFGCLTAYGERVTRPAHV